MKEKWASCICNTWYYISDHSFRFC